MIRKRLEEKLLIAQRDYVNNPNCGACKRALEAIKELIYKYNKGNYETKF